MKESRFFITSSNSQEELLQHFFEIIYPKNNTLPENPLEPEIVLVQNHGFQKWISLETAKAKGIIANTKFLFPNELIQMVFQKVLPDFKPSFSSQEVQWKIMEMLNNLTDDPEFDSIKNYLKDDRRNRAYQLSGMLSELFDQYETFRSDTLLAWENETPEHWVGQLWKRLPDHIRHQQKPFVKQQFFQQLKQLNPSDNQGVFSKRIIVFGISYLPPFHLEILKALSQFTDIHFLYFNPSLHFWGDTISDVQEKRMQLGRKDKAHDLHLDVGNPLLSTLGKYGRDFFNLLLDDDITADFTQIESTLFSQPQTILEKLQNDIFQLNNPKKNSAGEKVPVENDTSIQFHSCYSKMREVEVLKDQLLDLFQNQENNNFSPEDILVMTPDIEEYAPIIQAVFQSKAGESQHIPYSIADRVFTKETKAIQYFLNILEVIQSRFSIEDVMSLFESDAIRQKFSLSESDLDLVTDWLQRINIRWGINSRFKKTKGLPETHENSWRFGLDRILSGFGLASQNKILLFEDTDKTAILPFDDIEGGNAFMFGRFLDFFEALEALYTVTESSRNEGKTIGDWSQFLRQIPFLFFSEDPAWDQELLVLEMAINQFEVQAGSCSDDFKIDLEVVQSHLEKELGALIPSRGFLGNGVTFCSMKPMRSIPFKFVAILGLDNKAFPRISAPLSFDHLKLSQESGDRSIKEEDRYLFLETLLSARKKIYISYVGQSIKDNTELPPSTLVSELQNYLEDSYLAKGDLQQYLITQHPLQAFSRKYFQGQDVKLFSYSEENRLAAETLIVPDKKKVQGFELSIQNMDESFYDVDIEKLVRFFENPVRFLLTKRLGVNLDSTDIEFVEDEPFKLDYLTSYLAESQVHNTIMHDGDIEMTGKILKAQGILPHSHAGRVLFEDLSNEIRILTERIKPWFSEVQLDDFYYDFHIGKFHFKGKIGSLRKDTNLHFRPASVKIKDRLRSWLEHLVLNHLKPEEAPLCSTLIGYIKKSEELEVYQATSISNPEEYLNQVLELYLKGLTQPLAFLPRAAMGFMKEYKIAQDKGVPDPSTKGWNAAREEIYGNFVKEGELVSDPYFKKCFGQLDIQEETDFENNLLKLAGPMFDFQIKQEVNNG